MSKLATPSTIALACVLACAGCAEGAHGHGGRGGGGGGGSNFPTEAIAIAAVAAAEAAAVATMPPPTPDPDPDPDPYIGAYPPPPGPMTGSGNRTDFEPAAALAAIDHLDFGACRGTGTLIGWNHARLTFDPTGEVTRVLIEYTAGMPPEAIECLRSVLSTVQAPAFEGPAVTIGAAFFVQ